MSDPVPLPPALRDEVLRVLRMSEAERAAGLDALCQQHSEHAAALAALAAAEALGVQTEAGAARLASLRAWLQDPDQRYSLRHEVGRGGMGAVFKVRDASLGRHLAMKVIRLEGNEDSTPHEAVDPRVLERFLEEAQITGQLDHPGIVPVHELGVDAKGRAYFTMKLVHGQTADEIFAQARAGEGGWSRTRALEVLVKVCDALAFAHQKGVIHRDVKPSNVMVGRFGEVYVMDWGLAKVLGQKDSRDLRIRPESSAPSRVRTGRSQQAESDPDSPLVTMDGAVVGTPSYMPPEQAEGRVEDLGPRSDVYAVGAMLYTLLTGQVPYVKPGTRVSPYTVLRWVQDGPPSPVHALDPGVPAELVAICERAMARESGKRYADMRAVGEDLRAFLESRVVKSYRTGALVEMRMWVRRNRAVAAVAAALVLVAAGAFVWISVALREARVARKELVKQNKETRWELYVASVAAAAAAIERNEMGNVRKLLDAAPQEHRNWEWRHLLATSDSSLLVLRGHEGSCTGAVLSPDGSRVLTASADTTARLWDSATGRELGVFRGHERSVTCASFSPDGSRVLTGSDDGTARLWDPATWRELAVLRGIGVMLTSASFSPDGSRVLTTCHVSTVLWDALTGRQLARTGYPGVRGVFSPDGTRVLIGAKDHATHLWDPATGRDLALFAGHKGAIVSVCFSPDGSQVLAASEDKTARLWNAATGRELAVFRGHEARVSCVSFSPDGSRVLTGSTDSTARLWDASTGRELAMLRGHEHGVERISFSPDGSRVLTGSEDKTARLWDPATGRELAVLRGHENGLTSVGFSPDGSRVLTGSRDGTARLWDPALGRDPAVLRGREGLLHCASLSPDGSRAVTCSGDETARLWDPATGRELAVLRGHDSEAYWATFSPDGSRVLTGSRDDTARLWDPATGREIAVLRGHENMVLGVCSSPDGSRVLTGSVDGTGRVWDPATGRQLAVLRGHESSVLSVCFSRDGCRVLTGSEDKTARLWDPATGHELAVFRGHEGQVSSVCFSPDGSRVLTGSEDKSARLWDLASGRKLTVFQGHGDWVLSACFSPDGSRVLTGSIDTTARLWDPATGRELAVLRGHGTRACFSQDGSRILAASPDGTATVWHSVPYRQRNRDLELSRLAIGDAMRVLDSLGRNLPPEALAQHIRKDKALSPVVRMVALDLLLGRCQTAWESARRQFDALSEVSMTQEGLRRLVGESAFPDSWVRDEVPRLVERHREPNHELRDRLWKALCLEAPPTATRTQSVLRAIERNWWEPRNHQLLLGAAQSRCELHAEAIATLTAACADKPRPRALPFLAMSHHHLNHPQEAEQALTALEKALEPYPHSDLQPLLAEVRQLIRGK